MNDRLRIASEQMAANTIAGGQEAGAAPEIRVSWALAEADALIASAGRRDNSDGGLDNGGGRIMSWREVAASEAARAEAAEAKVALTESIIDDIKAQVVRLERRLAPPTRDELVESGEARKLWQGLTVTETIALVSAADRIRARRSE